MSIRTSCGLIAANSCSISSNRSAAAASYCHLSRARLISLASDASSSIIMIFNFVSILTTDSIS